MRLRCLAVFLLLVCLAFTVQYSSSASSSFDVQSRRDLDPLGAEANVIAAFAVEELKKLSDSRVYSTLTLSKIISAYQEEGIFHDNTIMKLELESPFYKSGNTTEVFEIIVMNHKEDGTKSLAIDEFPVMHEYAVEEFWIRKVKEKNIAREQSFRRLELESLLMEVPEEEDEEWDMYKMPQNLERKAAMDKESVSSLLELLDTSALKELRLQNSAKFQKQLKEGSIYLTVERALAKLPLQSLYEITVDPTETFTDFQVYRALQLVDLCILHLQKDKTAKRLVKSSE